MLWFIRSGGRRFYRLNTEIELAGEIHRALAPPVERRLGAYEVAGISRPSGQVGGDLLDVSETADGWLWYIADVSGHGVGAGVLMGVVKSAARTRLLDQPTGDGILPALHQSLHALLPCAPGDMLALYTDGLAEIFNAAGAEFGIEGLATALRTAAALPLSRAVEHCLAAATAFGPASDDQTLLLLHRTPNPRTT